MSGREREIDPYSYQLGVIDCFNEMVNAGVKRIAMSHPCRTVEERDGYRPPCLEICARYGTKMYDENDSFVTDLFPGEMNRGASHYIFYRNDEDLEMYLALKRRKEELISEGRYEGEERYRIAWDFGKLLSYTDEAVERMIRDTAGKRQAAERDR